MESEFHGSEYHRCQVALTLRDLIW